MKHMTTEQRCKEVAAKYGWHFQRVNYEPSTPVSKARLMYYRFDKLEPFENYTDVTLIFNRKTHGSGGYSTSPRSSIFDSNVTLTIAGLFCDVKALFRPDVSRYYRHPSGIDPANYAESILSRFDRQKLLDDYRVEVEKKMQKLRNEIIGCESLIERINKAANPDCYLEHLKRTSHQ